MNIAKKGKGKRTSSFGVSRREQHDSSSFYSCKMYEKIGVDEGLREVENSISAEILDRLLCRDSRRMDFLPESSVHLMVTSPPCNVSKEYDEDLSLEDYVQLLREVFSETYRVLVSGGRACINIANVGRKPYIPHHFHVIKSMLEIGFLMRGEIMWSKGASAGVSTAWGSWPSASNPTLRDVHEYLLVFSKEKFSRKKGLKKDTITREDFIKYTKTSGTSRRSRLLGWGTPRHFQ